MIKLMYPDNFIGITQKYKPKTKDFKGHLGIDLGWNNKYGGKNAPIYAAADGTVCAIKDNDTSNKSWGNYVKIDHGNKIYTNYAHLERGLVVKKNQKVKQGDLIGYMGNTGNSKGNHLHFEVYKGGSGTSYRVDPMLYTYVYPEQIVAESTKKEYPNLLYYTPEPEPTKYIEITAKSGLWCRKGVGFVYPKYKVIPYKTKCELLEKNVGKSNGYEWWRIIYENEVVYIPYKKSWVKEL